MVKKNHTHKLKRHRYKSGNEVYFCALPDCTYKINPALALGKKCICHRCGNEFVLTDYSVRLANPHCNNCHRPKGKVIEGDLPESPILDMDAIEQEIQELIHNSADENDNVEPSVCPPGQFESEERIKSLRDRLDGVVRNAEEEGEI